jgi:hypothetical protein
LSGWPSFGKEGLQEEGRLQSLHMRMRTPRKRAHKYTHKYTTHARTQHMHTYARAHTHTRTHKYTTHARMYVHNRIHTHVRNARTHTHVRPRTHKYARTCACIRRCSSQGQKALA